MTAPRIPAHTAQEADAGAGAAATRKPVVMASNGMYDMQLPISQPTPPPPPYPRPSSPTHEHAQVQTQLQQQHYHQQPPHPQHQQLPQLQLQQQQISMPNHQHPDISAQSQARSVKRPRPVKSCAECRKRKLKCSRLCPCSQCQKSNRICKYTADPDSGNYSDGSEGEVMDNRSVKRNHPSSTSGPAGAAGADSSSGQGKDGAAPSALEDLASRMEKLERHLMGVAPNGTDHSVVGPTFGAYPDTIRGLTVKSDAWRTRFFGQSSTRVLLNLFDEAKDMLSNPFIKEVVSSYKPMHTFLQDNYEKSLAPITVFVDSMMPVAKRMVDILPKKDLCDRLLASYINTSETIYRMIHLPSFEEDYRRYWEGQCDSPAFLPQLLTVLSIASRFDTKSRGMGHERTEGVHIPTACALVRSWLDGLRGKQLTDVKTLQVELLLLHAQRMITPRIQDSWAQLGFIVRLAMNMGLHRDPSEFEPRLTIFMGEIRRRLWFTILDMDLHLSLASSMPCLVREGDFSCRPPRNLDDRELFHDMTELPPSKPVDQFTDNQMQVYAAMTLGTRMKVSHLVNRVERMRDYDEILEVGSKLDRFLDDINYIFPRQGILNDTQKSRMWRSRVVLDMHVRRPLLALYRPFAIGAPDAPGQISRGYLRSSMVILKYLDELDPMLAHYQDIADMYHQILKGDIIQAALSVCFYIQSAVHPTSTGSALGQQGLRMSPDASEDVVPYNLNSSILWSPERLISTVEKTLDLLIHNIRGRDTKDVVCVALVLDSVRRADPRPEEIAQGLRAVLDACFRATNLSPDKLAAHVRGPMGPEPFQMDSYGGSNQMPPYHRNENSASMSSAADDFDDWIMWEGWE